MITCGCGLSFADAATLPKVGWQFDGLGGALLLVQCTCRSTFVAEVRDDACVCATCRRLVTGEWPDVKVCAEEGPEHDLRILCRCCARRENIGMANGVLPRRYTAVVNHAH